MQDNGNRKWNYINPSFHLDNRSNQGANKRDNKLIQGGLIWEKHS